ncbi:MAG: hypothetical protein ACJAZ2_000527 [Glaciecola sp.]
MEQKEITLEEVLDKLLSVIILIKKNYILVGVVMLASVAFGVMTRDDKVYTAKTTILLPSSAASGMLSLASQFGMSNEKGITFEKFKGIASSSTNLKKVLLMDAKIDGKPDKMIHFLMDELELRKANSSLADVDFNQRGMRQDSVLNVVIDLLDKRVQIKETIDELIKVEVTGKNEVLAALMNEELVNQTLLFFDESSVAEDIKTINNLELRRDSTKEELYREEMRLATLKDAAVRTVKSKGYVHMLRSEREFKILNETYVELIKQMQMLSFQIDNNRHNISIVDSPMLPLKGKRRSIAMTSIIFSIVGFIASLLLLIGGPLLLKAFKTVKTA